MYSNWNFNLKECFNDEEGKLIYRYFNGEKKILVQNSTRDLFELNGLSRKIFTLNNNNYFIFGIIYDK
jgi:hypothetical protein